MQPSTEACPAPSYAVRSVPVSKPDRHFHTIAAIVLIVLMLIGFHHFYFGGRMYPGRPLTPPIRTLIILHGSAMAIWMLVFLVQPLLILGKNQKLHRKVGSIGAVIASGTFLLGMKLGVESARVKPPGMLTMGLNAFQFMAIPVLSMIGFGGCIAAAVVYRRNPALHRSLMLIGTLFAISAAVARIDFLSHLYVGTIFWAIWGPFFMTVVVGFLLFLLKWTLARKPDPYLGIGCVGLALFSALNFYATTTPSWDRISHWLLQVTG